MDIKEVAEQVAKDTPLNDIHNVAIEFIERLYQAKGLRKVYSDRVIKAILNDGESLYKGYENE